MIEGRHAGRQEGRQAGKKAGALDREREEADLGGRR